MSLDFPNQPVVEGIKLSQSPAALSAFSVIIKTFDCIIELGTFKGGLSCWLEENKRNDAFFKTFDINPNVIEIPEHKKINIGIGDTLSSIVEEEIKGYINEYNRVLILCDGGDKIKEFKLYSKLLKSGDAIMLHDYEHENEEYKYYQKLSNWHWPSESSFNEIKESVEKNNLQEYYYDLFKPGFWGSFIKV